MQFLLYTRPLTWQHLMMGLKQCYKSGIFTLIFAVFCVEFFIMFSLVQITSHLKWNYFCFFLWNWDSTSGFCCIILVVLSLFSVCSAKFVQIISPAALLSVFNMAADQVANLLLMYVVAVTGKCWNVVVAIETPAGACQSAAASWEWSQKLAGIWSQFSRRSFGRGLLWLACHSSSWLKLFTSLVMWLIYFLCTEFILVFDFTYM